MTYRWSMAPLQLLPLGPLGMLEVAAEIGIDTVGLRLTRVTRQERYQEIVADPAFQHTLAGAARRLAVPVHDTEIARLDPETEPESLLPLLRATAQLGAGSIVTQLPDPEFGRACDHFGRLCDLAGPFGIRCEIEFLPWTATPDLTRAAAIVEAAGTPNAGIIVDLIHFHRSGSSIEMLRSLPDEWFQVVHLNDAPLEAPSDDAGLMWAARHERLIPGEGAIDVAGILGALPADLTLAVEVPHDSRVATMGVAGWAAESVRRCRAYVNALPAQKETIE